MTAQEPYPFRLSGRFNREKLRALRRRLRRHQRTDNDHVVGSLAHSSGELTTKLVSKFKARLLVNGSDRFSIALC